MAVRERVSFNAGWRFTRDDPAGAAPALAPAALDPWLLPAAAPFLYYEPIPPRRPEGNLSGDLPYVRPGFVDTAWRSLDLPHDWGIEGPFQQDLPGDTAKLPWSGVGWYRKTFTSPASDAGRRVHLDIDGAMSHSLVWLNGNFVGGWPYGYASFRLDLTPYLRPGTDNVLAIRLDNPPASSRWYPGGGVYRNVWLVKTAPVHVQHWGVFATTPIVTAEAATVEVRVDFTNDGPAPAELEIVVALHELRADGRPAGSPVAESAVQKHRALPGRPALTTFSLQVPRPQLWDLDTPRRYVAVTSLRQDGGLRDRVETPFGIRTIRFDATRGFLLNDRRVPLQGVCLHHDLGALGAAINVRAMERQLEILRAAGVNAIRTSHNPPAPEFVELCDRLGFLLQVEAFDCWTLPKTGNDYSRHFPAWHEADLRAMVRHYRNAPSIVLWSIGDEVFDQRERTDGWRLATRLAGIVREEDRTRAVTGGHDVVASGYNGFQTALDVFGYNYKPREYARFHERNPTVPIHGSETASTISSRGEYFFPVEADKSKGLADFQMSSYDLFAPIWANSPDAEFAAQDQGAFVVGEFVWTGFDYLGEPTPYDEDLTNMIDFTDPVARARAEQELQTSGKIRPPSRSSYFGFVDLAGFPKDRYYLYQARWRPELKMAHLLPHWTWPERIGQVTPVHVYTSGDEAELFLNGVSLGRQKRGERQYRFRWDEVVYQPGELKVVTYLDGRPWAEAVQRTAGPAAGLALAADRAALRADGTDLAFVTTSVTDAAGVLAPRAKDAITFAVTGPAEIIATDNGDATSFESFQSPLRRAYNGLALVVVRTKPGQPGEITLTATAENLVPARTVLRAE